MNLEGTSNQSDSSRLDLTSRSWVTWAISVLEAEAKRTADTHLLKLPIPGDWNVDIYLKDESTHTSGSLKHRLARSLFLFALCNGWIREGTPVVEASSGSTAISEAYFAGLLHLPFIAVMPSATSTAKVHLIERFGGRCHLVDDPARVYDEARQVATRTGGHYLDQFTYAERATDWRGNNNIAESIFEQMSAEEHPIPAWIVVGAGTGGTSATLGRYVRYRGHQTGICVVDPENSAFFHGWVADDPTWVTGKGSTVEGIGRPRMELSFIPTVVDRMIRVPDAGSFAAMRLLDEMLGRRAGGSSGTNFFGTLKIACEMKSAGKSGSIVTLLCDDGTRYAGTYYSDAWLEERGLLSSQLTAALRHAIRSGEWVDELTTPPHLSKEDD